VCACVQVGVLDESQSSVMMMVDRRTKMKWWKRSMGPSGRVR